MVVYLEIVSSMSGGPSAAPSTTHSRSSSDAAAVAQALNSAGSSTESPTEGIAAGIAEEVNPFLFSWHFFDARTKIMAYFVQGEKKTTSGPAKLVKAGLGAKRRSIRTEDGEVAPADKKEVGDFFKNLMNKK